MHFWCNTKKDSRILLFRKITYDNTRYMALHMPFSMKSSKKEELTTMSNRYYSLQLMQQPAYKWAAYGN
ncbi:hypothetical protein GCM10023331_00090 [Algivirga pacifica]|uniref:Uncharacterized protein n=1 Tax=Algivirga pacifica TaxID=1162670 RepID=A0ABP9D1H9_9BACT